MLQHIDSTIKKYIGKRIEAITRVNDYQVLIQFVDGTKTDLSVDGDCCSTSIFYEIEFPDACKGAEVTYIDQSEGGENERDAVAKVKAMPTQAMDEYTWGLSNGNCFSVWNVLFKTTHGDIRIRHINSSNGYYDGCLSFTDYL